jgi:hypothetical protein
MEGFEMFTWLENLKASLMAKYLGSLVRTAVAALAGVIGALGVVDPVVLAEWVDPTTAIITAVAAYLLTQLWSLKQKAS